MAMVIHDVDHEHDQRHVSVRGGGGSSSLGNGLGGGDRGVVADRRNISSL